VDHDPRDPCGWADFDSHVTRAQRRLFAFIYSLVYRHADAEDILQECNVVFCRKSREFQPGTDFMAWACCIAKRQVLAFRKKQGRAHEHFDDALIDQLGDEAQHRFEQLDLRLDILRECVQQLPEEKRALVARRYEACSSVKDMARASGRSPKAVSEDLRRIREHLMRCVERKME
jgi:RNA polymerase sigma-70 factor (ECF subfamily)